MTIRLSILDQSPSRRGGLPMTLHPALAPGRVAVVDQVALATAPHAAPTTLTLRLWR